MTDPGTGCPTFLAWQDFLTLCLDNVRSAVVALAFSSDAPALNRTGAYLSPQALPINDTWLLAGRQWAAAGRVLLDDLSLTGGITRVAVQQLQALVLVSATHVRTHHKNQEL